MLGCLITFKRENHQPIQINRSFLKFGTVKSVAILYIQLIIYKYYLPGVEFLLVCSERVLVLRDVNITLVRCDFSFSILSNDILLVMI